MKLFNSQYLSLKTLYHDLPVSYGKEVSQTATLNGKPITVSGILADKKENPWGLVFRGSTINEAPFGNKSRGLLSSGEITSRRKLVEHTRGGIGISTSINSIVARHFAMMNVRKVAVHLWHTALVPEKDKTYVPAALENCHYENNWECELALHYSMPRMLYTGYRSVSPLFPRGEFNANKRFIDPAILKSNSALQSEFYSKIYYPFTRHVGPDLRTKKISDTDLNQYDKNCKDFYFKYRLFQQKTLHDEKKATSISLQR
ncbi:MAG: hypothetical protein NTU49_11115 [Gammaproteobacteria bacterium]|nr:hypothetical protein [Gammaproteobacteria bacterium]